jgi:hypothetical protein
MSREFQHQWLSYLLFRCYLCRECTNVHRHARESNAMSLLTMFFNEASIIRCVSVVSVVGRTCFNFIESNQNEYYLRRSEEIVSPNLAMM